MLAAAAARRDRIEAAKNADNAALKRDLKLIAASPILLLMVPMYVLLCLGYAVWLALVATGVVKVNAE